MEGIGLFSKWDVLTSQAYAPHMPAIASKKMRRICPAFFSSGKYEENMAGIFGLSKFPCLGSKKMPGICPAFFSSGKYEGRYGRHFWT